MLRFLTAGESHGPGLVTIVEGLPKGLEVSAAGIAEELARRRLGYGRGRRMTLERDELDILGGVRHGRTLGSPVAVVVRNTEWPRWQADMSPDPGHARNPISRPRPGHADLTGMLKYDTEDARDILERASARETAARTVAGYLASRLLDVAGVSILSHVISIGSIAHEGPSPGPGDRQQVDRSPVRAFDERTSAAMVELIEKVMREKDTLGGVFEVLAFGVVPGVGSYVHYDRRLDGVLAAALMSIPAIKGVEIGDGFEVARRPGSEAHDEMQPRSGGVSRVTNRAGGLEGGMSNGEVLRVRAAMKPISTLMRPLSTVDLSTGESAKAVRERSDVCAVPAAAVVGEQMVAWVLAAEYLRKFGGDTVGDFAGSLRAYQTRLAGRFDH